MKYAEKVLAEESLIFDNSAKAVEGYRMEVALAVLRDTDDLSMLCHCCGESETEKGSDSDSNTTDWIECDQCQRWYHNKCVGNPDGSVSYSCGACRK
ncbi:PHD finger protein ALFIN-LIKE 1-like [Melanotaenia boesemani]|uniref:PHD finger protein ALFIN-LIKE 1-like n=1 Tax=Melanotaenia boesemani TaxID=1250792 RepID=UPI001C03E8CF|nr:PHD finger protein ALFIN-LIKE 1-like [Melanotaenia boesemani]